MTFPTQDFDKIPVQFPFAGMNRDIAPHLLPAKHAWYLENFTQDSLGNGTLRCGVNSFAVFALVDDFIPLRGFPFISQEFGEQIISYLSVFIQDNNAGNITLNNQTISLTTNAPFRYVNDSFVKIVYTYNNLIQMQRLAIYNVQINNNNVTFTIRDAVLPNVLATSLYFSEGQVFCTNVSTKLTSKIYDGLRVDCIPRAVHFMEKLILCNGLDPLLVWDGTTMSIVFEWVKEKALEIAKPGDNTLKFKCTKNPNKYLTATSIFFNDHEFQITNKVVADNIVTLTLTEQVGNVPQQIFFKSFPPRCNFLYVAQDRIWGLGQGAAGLKHRNPFEAMRVYRNSIPNAYAKWLVEDSQEYQDINLSNKHGIVDNLESIAQAGSRIVFIGREKTQVYGGLVADNSFSWQSTVSSGSTHGDLVLEEANDIFFVNASGFNSFSTLNIGNQFAATPLSAVNSLIKEYVIDAMKTNIDYRSSFLFSYSLGSFIGLKIGKNPLIHALFSTQPYFFSLFSGDFLDAHIFQLGNRLFFLKDKEILFYGDGRDGNKKSLSDRGKAIVGAWHQPFNQNVPTDFCSQRVTCLADYSNTFVTNSNNGVSIGLFNDRNKSSEIKKMAFLQPRKDDLKSNIKEIDNLEFVGKYKTLFRRLKSRGTESWLFLSAISVDSPFSIKEIIFYGRRYR